MTKGNDLPKGFKITQSFVKDARAYFAEGSILCGHPIRERYINGRFLDDPEREPGALELGCYVEWLLTGAIPKNGKTPVPQYKEAAIKKNGGKTEGLTVEDMYVEYRTAHDNVQAIRLLLASYDLKIVSFGKTITKGRFAGTLDLICEAQSDREFEGISWKKGDILVIDLKYSGLMSDNGAHWKNQHGWQFSPVQKKYHGTQAKQYHFLTGWPFFFLVCQSNNKEKTAPHLEFFYVPITPEMLEDHVKEGNFLRDKLEFEATIGFEARPNYVKCEKCPLRGECEDRQTYPVPRVVDLTID